MAYYYYYYFLYIDIFFFWRGLYSEGLMFAIFALFYFAFEGIFKVQAARVGGGVYSEGRSNGGFFLRYDSGELIFGGAYTWRGLLPEFYGTP